MLLFLAPTNIIFFIPCPLVFLAFPKRAGPTPLVASAIATIPAGGVVPRSVLVIPVLPLASHWHAEGAGAGLVEDPTLVTGKLEEEGALSASPLLDYIEAFSTAQEAHHSLALNGTFAPDVHAGAPHAPPVRGLGAWPSGASCTCGKASTSFFSLALGTSRESPPCLEMAVCTSPPRSPLHLAPVAAAVPEALPPGLPPAVSGQPAVPAAPSSGLPAAHIPDHGGNMSSRAMATT